MLGSGLLSGTRLSVGIRVQVKDQANTGIGVVVWDQAKCRDQGTG